MINKATQADPSYQRRRDAVHITAENILSFIQLSIVDLIGKGRKFAPPNCESHGSVTTDDLLPTHSFEALGMNTIDVEELSFYIERRIEPYKQIPEQLRKEMGRLLNPKQNLRQAANSLSRILSDD